MRPRQESAPRCLTPEQRANLRRRIAAVPVSATLDHPTVVDLLAFYESLRIPWWAHPLDYRIRLGDIAAGLASMRRLLEVDDWGAEPR